MGTNLQPRIDPVFEEGCGQVILNLLNGELLKHPRQWAGFWAVTPAAVTANQVAYRTAASELHLLLTEWVNEWIDSGLRSDGSEVPSKRSLKASPQLLRVLEDSSDIARIRFSFAQGFPVAELTSWRLGEGSLAEDRSVENDPIAHSEYEAAHILTMILLSADWRSRIARCRKCNCYFFLRKTQRGKPKRVWANGCFCLTAHNKARASAKWMTSHRLKNREDRIKWAANELRKRRTNGTSWYKDKAFKKKLVVAVNQGIAGDPNQKRDVIKVNWITQYQRQIQKQANRPQPQIK